MRFLTFMCLTLFLASCSNPLANGYHLTKTTPVSGEGGWDFLTVDSPARRVYISHNVQVDVLDADSSKVMGTIPNTFGVHGIAIASDLGRGFVSNGKADTVTIFDIKTLEPLSEVKAGKNPDTIIYDSSTHHVFVFNAGSDSATIINARTGKLVGTIDLGGTPEFAVASGAGHVFVNLENKNELIEIDARKLNILKRWSVAPGYSPASLAIDQVNHRLFVGCHNKLLVVVNADTGKVITTLPIGDKVDATAFDAETKLIISSNGEGTLSVIHQDTPDSYRVVETVNTRKRSKTFALDSKTHRLFIPAAEFGQAPAPTLENPKPRPPMIPGSFAVLIFDQ